MFFTLNTIVHDISVPTLNKISVPYSLDILKGDYSYFKVL